MFVALLCRGRVVDAERSTVERPPTYVWGAVCGLDAGQVARWVWVSYMRVAVRRPDAAVRAATA